MDHYLRDLQLLLLLITANGMPILARKWFGACWARAIDGGRHAWDERPWLGASKTWRGLLAALAVTPVMALLLGLEAGLGFLIALGAMAGDLASSFLKRRLGIPPSGQALLLDQVPEALLPLLLVAPMLQLALLDILILVLAFVLLEMLLSRILYVLHIRRRPY
ncbi:MAG TPA: CDP-archaeol synthase [Gammaproteobacteria bacterium]